jgi:hypothetical protein
MKDWLKQAHQINEEFNNSEYGKLSESKIKIISGAITGGMLNVQNGHINKLNKEILTSEKRSENRKLKFEVDVVKSICDESLTLHEVAKKLDLTLNTTRRILKEYSLYEEFKNKPKPEDWNKRFISYGGAKTNKVIRMYYYCEDCKNGKGEFIKEFHSITEASEETQLSAISKVLNGKQKRCGRTKDFAGYYFEEVYK